MSLRFVCLALGLAASGCASASRGCVQEQWQGQCSLVSFIKVEDAELPTPHVVYQAIYRPLQNPSHPSYTPPEISQEITAMSRDEDALLAHMDHYRSVECHLVPVQSETCVPAQLRVAVPEFQSTGGPAPVASGPRGCEKIEQGAQGQVGAPSANQLQQVFSFASKSAETTPEMVSVADSVVQSLAQKPGIECVGLVGQVAPGESIGLGEQRARAIKQLLVQRGVDGARLMTISATTPMYGVGMHGGGGSTTQSQVTLKVVLESR